jgi:hypothetical protein
MPSRPRFYDFRSSLGPAAVGMCATDSASLLAICNEAQERLINDPLAPDEGWFGGWAKMAFTVSRASPTIVTPAEVARIILLDVCRQPVQIHNSFYEYLTYGIGLQPRSCCGANGCQTLAAFERETVTVFTPLLSTPQYLRCYASDPTDVGRSVLLQGKDSNGSVIRFIDPLSNASGLGEKVILDAPFVTSANAFSEVSGIQKQKSFGEVQIYQVDPTSGVETPLVVMAPGEVTAQYRTYYVSGVPSNCCNTPGGAVQVTAQCKLDFVPAACDSDYLCIQSVPALIDMCMSIRYGRIDTAGAQQLSEAKHLSAIRILNGQLDHLLGRDRPAIQRRLFGSDAMQPIHI